MAEPMNDLSAYGFAFLAPKLIGDPDENFPMMAENALGIGSDAIGRRTRSVPFGLQSPSRLHRRPSYARYQSGAP